MEFTNLDAKTLKLWEGFRDSFVKEHVLTCAGGLAERDFDVTAVPTASEANRSIVGRISRHQHVYYWGEASLEELGILDTLSARGNPVNSVLELYGGKRRSRGRTPKMTPQDVFLTSVCAVTLDGILVKIEPEGIPLSRPWANPGTIIVVAGVNKIVGDIPEGLRRAKDVCIPHCAKLLGLDLPCVKKGHCVECDTPHPMCAIHTLATRSPEQPGIEVVLIGERLGY